MISPPGPRKNYLYAYQSMIMEIAYLLTYYQMKLLSYILKVKVQAKYQGKVFCVLPGKDILRKATSSYERYTQAKSNQDVAEKNAKILLEILDKLDTNISEHCLEQKVTSAMELHNT